MNFLHLGLNDISARTEYRPRHRRCSSLTTRRCTELLCRISVKARDTWWKPSRAPAIGEHRSALADAPPAFGTWLAPTRRRGAGDTVEQRRRSADVGGVDERQSQAGVAVLGLAGGPACRVHRALPCDEPRTQPADFASTISAKILVEMSAGPTISMMPASSRSQRTAGAAAGEAGRRTGRAVLDNLHRRLADAGWRSTS